VLLEVSKLATLVTAKEDEPLVLVNVLALLVLTVPIVSFVAVLAALGARSDQRSSAWVSPRFTHA